MWLFHGGAVRMDLEYIDKWSLWLDFKILLKTVPAVVSGRGAYWKDKEKVKR
jgi:lipopolysaccharide/colanic/teichoic acid biosynthesis glycosyltransferase